MNCPGKKKKKDKEDEEEEEERVFPAVFHLPPRVTGDSEEQQCVIQLRDQIYEFNFHLCLSAAAAAAKISQRGYLFFASTKKKKIKKKM